MTVPVPSLLITKGDGSLGLPASADPKGVLAILAPLITGPSTPTPMTNRATVVANWGQGLIAEIASYVLKETKKQVLIVPTEYTTAPDYGTFDYVGTGTLDGFITETAGTTPVDDFFDVTVRFITAGTTGSAGITYQTSIDAREVDDDSKSWSAVLALGTALVLAIPGTGVSFDFATAKTVVAGDYFTCPVTGPRLTDADVLNGLDKLGPSSQPWECVLVEGIDASSTTVSNLDGFLEDIEAVGKFKMFICGARLRALNGSETEAQYLTAQTTAWAAVGSIRGSVTADGEILTSPNRGIDMVRKATIPYAARLMKVDRGVDAAQVDVGNLAGTRITDPEGNLIFHDEENDPGLNTIRLVTLRRWGTKSGVFITNPLIISTLGSDYVLAQQVRCMNAACEAAYEQCVNEMSKGIFQDRTTGKIREDSAQAIEAPVNAEMRRRIGSQVQDVVFGLNRDDVLSPPIAVLNGAVEMVTLIYIKGFAITATLVREITINGGGQ